QDQAGVEDRDLRRARRRAVVGRPLPRAGADVCLALDLPRARGAARGRAGRAGGRRRARPLEGYTRDAARSEVSVSLTAEIATQTRADAKLSRTRSVAALRVREHTEGLEDTNLVESATRSKSG